MRCPNCGYNNESDATLCRRCYQPLQKNEELTGIIPTGNSAQPEFAVSDAQKTIVKIIDQEPTRPINPVQSFSGNTDGCTTIHSECQQPEHTVVMTSQQQQPSTVVMKQDMESCTKYDPMSSVWERVPQEVPQKTIVKKPAQAEVAKTTIRQTVHECPHCGFSPVLGSETNCPHCKKPMNNNGNYSPNVKSENEPTIKSNSENRRDNTSAESAIKQQKTICRPFYRNDIVNVPKSKPAEFKLTLLPEDGEEAVSVTKQYCGDKVSLNRDNTEPNNMSITSKEQAEIVREDGHWFLENKSNICTTYLVVERKMELRAGDIIILGNRRFKFDV